MSLFGGIPDDLDYSFNPCRRPTEEEKKNLAQNVSGAVNETFKAGIVSQKMALRELKRLSEQTGMWASITEEDIDRASDDFDMLGENEMPPRFMDAEIPTIAELGME